MDIAKRIKTIREKKGMSQKELISAVDMGAVRYSRIENGKVEPSISTLEKLASVFDVSMLGFLSQTTWKKN